MRGGRRKAGGENGPSAERRSTRSTRVRQPNPPPLLVPPTPTESEPANESGSDSEDASEFPMFVFSFGANGDDQVPQPNAEPKDDEPEEELQLTNHPVLQRIFARVRGPKASGTTPEQRAWKERIDHLEREVEDYANTGNTLTLRERILTSLASLEVKSVLLKRLKEAGGAMSFMSSSAEHQKQLLWVERMVEFPWGIVKPIALRGTTLEGVPREVQLLSHLEQVRIGLDASVYGNLPVKEAILAHIARTLYAGEDRSHTVICMVGSPGIGKTRISKAIGMGLGIPMTQVSLAGGKDPHTLSGHGSAYVGSQYGKLTAALVSAKQLNTLIFVDELEKAEPNVSSVLLHAMDCETNHQFDGDLFTAPLKLDFSKVCWIAACNDLTPFPAPLLDRMLVLRVPDPTLDDKVQILQRHILPEAAEDHGLGDTVVLPKEGAAHLVRKVSQHDAGAKGLRQVKRSLHGILSRVLLLRLSAASSLSMGPVLDDLKMDFHRRSMLLDVDWTAPQTVLDGRIIDALYTSGDADFSASLAMYS